MAITLRGEVLAVAGYPDVAVPAGFVFALPVGNSFLGVPGASPKLLKSPPDLSKRL
jgi:hypothetical protein